MLEEPLLVVYLVRVAALVSTRTVYLAELKLNATMPTVNVRGCSRLVS